MASARALGHASTIVGLMTRTQRALRRHHLVDIASALRRELRLDLEDMRALRLPIDLLAFFPHWRDGSRDGFRPRALGVRLLPDAAASPLRALRIQISPSTGAASLSVQLVSELARCLDRDVNLVALIDPGADVRELQRALKDATAASRRTRVVASRFSTIFARDNAIAARDRQDRPALIVPRTVRGLHSRDADPLEIPTIQRRLSLRVITSRFHWHGGNILFDGVTLAVGADTIAENAARLGLTSDEVTRALSVEFGHDVTVMGDPRAARMDVDLQRMTSSGQASYHIDLDVALLGPVPPTDRPVALVADAQQGLQLLPGLAARDALPRAAHLSATRARERARTEYQRAARERKPTLQAYRETLAARGYKIVGVPELRTRRVSETALGLQDFVYCNILPGLNRRRPAIHFLPNGVPALDRAARAAYEQAGVRAVTIARTPSLAVAMMERAAGLRCFCGAMP